MARLALGDREMLHFRMKMFRGGYKVFSNPISGDTQLVGVSRHMQSEQGLDMTQKPKLIDGDE